MAKTSETYWSEHNVTNHRIFKTRLESLNYLAWRNRQYIYLDEYLLKRSEIQGKVILDFGCGPGNDLVWYLERGVKKAIGIDVSKKSLEEAHQRLKLHGNNFELIHTYGTENFRIEDRSVDVITCYGVLHHIDDLTQILSEFKRILKPDGEIRIMVYNRDSVWYHLYVAHVLAYSTQIDSRLTDKIRRSLKKESATIQDQN